MARGIHVDITGDSRSLERAFARSERSAKQFQGTMARTSASVKSSMASMVGPAAIGAGVLMLGKQFVDASRNAQVILGQTSIAVQDAGINWATYAKSVEDASMRISTASAFDDEAVLQSFQVFVRGQKDVARSLQLTELAADVARGRYTDLESATMLVNKAAMGQIGALRRAGIQIDKNATSAQALDELLKAYGGSAQKYADSAAGSSDKLRVAWENLAEQAGGPLSDALAVLAGQLTTIVGLMQKAGSLKFPTLPVVGGGGSLGGLAKKVGGLALLPGMAPIILTKEIIDKIRGGGASSSAGKAGSMLDPITSMVQGLVGGVGKAADQQRTAQAMKGALGTLNTISSFVDKWAGVGQKAAAAQKAADRAKAAAAAAAKAQQATLDRLQLNVDKTGLTDTLQDDLKALRHQQQVIEQIISTQGSTLALQQQLLGVELNIKSVQGQIADNRRQQAETRKAATKAAREAADEAKRAATERQMGWLDFAVEKAQATAGTGDDRAAYRRVEQALMARIRKEGHTLDLTRQLWQARQNIRDLNKRESEKLQADVRGDQTSFRHLSSSRFIDALGLDLSPAERATLRQGLTQVGVGGTVPRQGVFAPGGANRSGGVVITGDVHVHGVTDLRQFENDLTKRAKSRAHTRRGP